MRVGGLEGADQTGGNICNIQYTIYLKYDDDDQDWGRLQGADETGGNISGLASAAAKPTVTLNEEEDDLENADVDCTLYPKNRTVMTYRSFPMSSFVP